jgi:hypothetical protein
MEATLPGRDITDVVEAGENTLLFKVVNLWSNA